jgi:hypothetical protein
MSDSCSITLSIQSGLKESYNSITLKGTFARRVKTTVSAPLLQSHRQVRAHFDLTLLSGKLTLLVHSETPKKTGQRQDFRQVLQKIPEDRTAPGFLVGSCGSDQPRQDLF